MSLNSPQVRQLDGRTPEGLKTHTHLDTLIQIREAIFVEITAMTTGLAAMDRSETSCFRRFHNLGLRSPVKVTGMHVSMQMMADTLYFVYCLAGQV